MRWSQIGQTLLDRMNHIFLEKSLFIQRYLTKDVPQLIAAENAWKVHLRKPKMTLQKGRLF